MIEYEYNRFKIDNNDCLSALKLIENESFDCCVTSPPYYGLRDYGTGKWVGGDPNCPHRRMSKYSEKTITGHAQEGLRGMVGDAIYKSVCPLCGAVRVDRQIGLEETPEEYIRKMVAVFHEVKRCLKDDGTLWINIGDSWWGSGSRGYDFTDKWSDASKVQSNSKGTENLTNIPKLVGNRNGLKNKDLIGIPWMLAFALRADGWYLRQDIIWAKTNCMPESVKDRCTKSHEYIFLLSKNSHYFYDADAIRTPISDVPLERTKYGWDTDVPSSGTKGIHTEKMGNRFAPTKGANKRDVWTTPTSGGYKDEDGSHYATYSTALIEPCILAGSRKGGVVLDPFNGTGTTGACALNHGRNYYGIELNEKYAEMSRNRLFNQISQTSLFA